MASPDVGENGAGNTRIYWKCQVIFDIFFHPTVSFRADLGYK